MDFRIGIIPENFQIFVKVRDVHIRLNAFNRRLIIGFETFWNVKIWTPSGSGDEDSVLRIARLNSLIEIKLLRASYSEEEKLFKLSSLAWTRWSVD